MTRWEYLVMPLKDAARLKKDSNGLAPGRLNELGAEGWEAVGVSLKQGDLVAWPVVLLKRPIRGDTLPGDESRHRSHHGVRS
jgi:hypothetical protein